MVAWHNFRFLRDMICSWWDQEYFEIRAVADFTLKHSQSLCNASPLSIANGLTTSMALDTFLGFFQMAEFFHGRQRECNYFDTEVFIIVHDEAVLFQCFHPHPNTLEWT